MGGQVRTAPGPYPPDFEPVDELRDVITLVPRVLLSATLTGPTPSGSAGASRLCRGCSHPPRRFPDQAAPSFAALLRQGQRRTVSHLHSNHSASRRTKITVKGARYARVAGAMALRATLEQ